MSTTLYKLRVFAIFSVAMSLSTVALAPATAEACHARRACRECNASVAPSDSVAIKPAAPPRIDLWLVDARDFATRADLSTPEHQLRFWHHDADNGWQQQDDKAFFSGESAALPTTIYVHGNRVTESQAFSEASFVEESLFPADVETPRRRFVMWSWPSDLATSLPLNDVRIKYRRTPTASAKLVETLQRMADDAPISLVGYSFGARIVTGALHQLGGEHAARYPTALIAAAVTKTALSPGGEHENALATTSSLLILTNRNDNVLRNFWRIHRGRGGPGALGYSGIPEGSEVAPEFADRVTELDVSSDIPRGHDIEFYLSSTEVTTAVRKALTAVNDK